MSTWLSILSRKKPMPTATNDEQKKPYQLARILTTVDLTFLGVGSTLGVGVYVLAGHVAKETAGPAVVISFLIAAIASAFAGLCYAEFGARVPRAGSAYIYSYVAVGEVIAFTIGWNLILEYVIGSASVAKALSVYLDTLLNNTLKNKFIEVAPIHTSFMSEYFDFFSFTISLLLGGALAFGLKESSLANNIITSINILVVLFVIIAGAIKAKPENWHIAKNETIPAIGGGGFFPFGVEGVIKGAATCFYGFVGFDCIATTGEEVKNPKRAIPISIILSLFIIFLAYFGTSAVVTLMVPYYLQDSDAPFTHAFEVVGWSWAKWIVGIGGMFGLCASLFGAMFPLPRIIYAMANDALVFKFLGTINERFKTPVTGTLLAALLTGLMSAIFNLNELVNMMSIGTLMAYTIVAACVIILRYTQVAKEKFVDGQYSLLLQHEMGDTEDEYSEVGHTYEENEAYTDNSNLIPPHQDVTIATLIQQMFNFSNKKANYLTQRLVTTLVFIFCLFSLILACLVSYLLTDLVNGELWAVVPTSITVFFMLVILVAISAQPKVHANLSFKVPLVPLIPALSICINIYLMLMLDGNTWIRFGIWMLIGLPIYLYSCKPYHPTKPTKNAATNGQVNTPNSKSNGTALTIPDIKIDPPSTIDCGSEDGSVKNKKQLRQRTLSIDSNALTNAVLELDKVLDESENEFINFEAINPENEYKNTSILTKLDNTTDTNGSIRTFNEQIDNLSVCSSNSGSIHSKEHHIEVQVHQEDSDLDDNNETGTTNYNIGDETIYDATNSSSSTNNETKTDNDATIDETTTTTDDINEAMDEPSTTTIDNSTTNNETIADDNETIDDDNETNATIDLPNYSIPVPPPLLPLLNGIPPKSPVPKTARPKPPLEITQQNLSSVELRPVPKRARSISTISTTSEGPTDNVKAGSLQYNKLRNKLDGIFKKRVTLPIPERRYYVEEKQPSPSVQKQLEVIDQVLEQFEEDIPDNFGKTSEFKEELNNLLLRRHSAKAPEKESVKNFDTNQQNNSKTDETNHRKLMAESFKSIRLRKTGIIDETDDETEDPPQDEVTKKEKDQNKIEKDKEQHRRLMNATLRSIQLRKTGLNLNEDTSESTDINTVDR